MPQITFSWSQAARTIRIVISVPPGGTIDLLSRVLADQIGKTNGQTLIVESKPGGGGIIAAETVARATPDGNTLLVNTNGMVISAILRKVNYDPVASYEPICYLVRSPQVIVVNSASPYRTLSELIDAARAKPAELSIASVGPNTTQHIAIEQLKRLAGINLTYVPYTGGAPAINALLGGHVTAVFQNYSEIGEQLRSGKLRALATPSAQAHRAVAGPADGGGVRLQGLRCRGVVRDGDDREDAEGNGVATRRLVQRGLAGTGGQSQARQAGALSQPGLRRGFRGAYSPAVRRRRFPANMRRKARRRPGWDRAPACRAWL